MLNLNTLKQEIFNEHNRIRKNPKSYIPLLEKYLGYFKDGVIYKPEEPNVGIMTEEGPSAYKNCIKFLNQQKPIKELQLNSSVSKAAQDHANDIGPKGMTDHTGSNGSGPSDRIEKYLTWDITIAENLDFGGKTGEEIILSLIVDDGVPNRGHRSNIFKEDINFLGIGLSKHQSDFEVCTVINYVGDIVEEKSKQKDPSLDTIRVKMNSVVPNKKQQIDKRSESPPKKEDMKDKAKSQAVSPKKRGDKLENFFAPKNTYNFSTDEDKPKGAVDVKIKTSVRKANGLVTKNIVKTYKMKDGSEVVLEIEEINQ